MKIGRRGRLVNKVCVVVGGAGFLGAEFSSTLHNENANVVVIDKNFCDKVSAYNFILTDITKEEEVIRAKNEIVDRFGKVDILINCAANDPKVGIDKFCNFETFTIDQWDRDLAVGLTGMFICCKIFGTYMANTEGGVIVNVASDLSVIAPDQRIYKDGAKPVSYSVLKHGVIGLTKYISTYWPNKVRINALSPGGIYNNHSEDFINRLVSLIPMGRMAKIDEYNEALIFLCSDASKYMTGQNIVIDGGRTVW